MGASTGYPPFDGSNCVAQFSGKSLQHGDGGLQSPIDLRNEYARGALCVIIQFDGRTSRCPGKIGPLIRATDNNVATQMNAGSVWPHDSQGGMSCGSENRIDDSVLVRVIEQVEFVECRTAATREGFCTFDGVFHPLTGCFYSLAGGFETNPAIACREFEVAVLCAAVHSDQRPSHMVEGAPHIVDSIAYYKGEGARNWLVEPDTQNKIPSIGIAIDDKSVRFSGNKGVELPFEVRNVIIGPLDFLFGALEHA
jgi:hypothetical protein